MLVKVKQHMQENKDRYMIGAGCLITGVAAGVIFQSRPQIITEGVNTVVKPVALLSKQSVVTVIEANRQGPPSWVVRCLETGEIFSSQSAAARAMDVMPIHISQHLRGLQEHVNGLHFERICLAA